MNLVLGTLVPDLDKSADPARATYLRIRICWDWQYKIANC
jgi:hypothetical protein